MCISSPTYLQIPYFFILSLSESECWRTICLHHDFKRIHLEKYPVLLEFILSFHIPPKTKWNLGLTSCFSWFSFRIYRINMSFNLQFPSLITIHLLWQNLFWTLRRKVQRFPCHGKNTHNLVKFRFMTTNDWRSWRNTKVGNVLLYRFIYHRFRPPDEDSKRTFHKFIYNQKQTNKGWVLYRTKDFWKIQVRQLVNTLFTDFLNWDYSTYGEHSSVFGNWTFSAHLVLQSYIHC